MYLKKIEYKLEVTTDIVWEGELVFVSLSEVESIELDLGINIEGISLRSNPLLLIVNVFVCEKDLDLDGEIVLETVFDLVIELERDWLDEMEEDVVGEHWNLIILLLK